nr:HlyD family type I secretion periplasmic adaptor subunit [Shimwellia pseudoproteus]
MTTEYAAVNERYFVRFGWLILLGGMGSFLLWATLAPLDKGVASPGTVMVDGYRKVIQSPVSGVVTQILVKDGQQVRKGDQLVLLSQKQAQAQQVAARQRYITALVTARRLDVELQGGSRIGQPVLGEDEIAPAALHQIIRQQNQLMQARQTALKNAQQGDEQAIAGLSRQRDALIQASRRKQTGLALLNRQLQDLKPLTAEGYYPRNRYLETQRQSTGLAGEISETESNIVQLTNQIAQKQRDIRQRVADNQKEIESQLEDIRLQISESKKQLILSDVDLARTQITAPQDGVIMNLTLANTGAVVNPGEQLMELVPQKSTLIVEARLDVAMIDRVHNGLPVTLLFSAFNHQRTPRVPGSVTLVSADRQTDPVSHQPYYKIQAAVSPEGMKMLKGEVIRPGMPVEVFIKTGERSLLNYLMKPIADRAFESFIEE